MAITRKFIWAKDRDHGSMGWLPKNIPHFNVSDGLGVTHDVMEHFSSRDDSIESEMMAFGSMLYIRGMGDYWAAINAYYPNPADQMPNDIARFLGENGEHITAPRSESRMGDSDADDILEATFAKVRALLPDELDCWSAEFDIEPVIMNAMAWVRIGYVACARRFHQNSPYAISDTFQEIENYINDQHATGRDGDTMTVRVCPRELDWKIVVSNEFGLYE